MKLSILTIAALPFIAACAPSLGNCPASGAVDPIGCGAIEYTPEPWVDDKDPQPPTVTPPPSKPPVSEPPKDNQPDEDKPDEPKTPDTPDTDTDPDLPDGPDSPDDSDKPDRVKGDNSDANGRGGNKHNRNDFTHGGTETAEDKK